MPLVLVPRRDPTGPLSVELDGVVPDRVARLSAAEVARLPVRADGRPRPLGDLFDISGAGGDGTLECRGDFSRVHRVGAGMASGRILVAGPVGRHSGERMTGGALVVEGDAGDWLAAEMSGGSVRVAGSAGDNLAGALPGSDAGLRGGVVIVTGAAGDLAAARMRRGLVAIGGGCGTAAGFEMRGGLLTLAGAIGPQPGLAMRRGTILALITTPAPPMTFARGSCWSPPLVPLVLRRLARAGFAPASTAAPGPWRHWHGDLLAGGRGELFHPE
ncbi:MAG: formylmethanofuran dehydrogenase subunit C [Planctomycetaceae bacterium]